MDPGPTLQTQRLTLRPWRDSDLPPFAALNASPEVCRFLPSTLSRAESDAMAARARAAFTPAGFGLFALARRDLPGAPFIGFAGLARPRFEAPFTPCVEIGWRLAEAHWGQGLATEAAQAVLAHAFGPLALEALVSFTATQNLASARVMQKLGMVRDPAGDFEHPALPRGHPLRPHLLYRLEARVWRGRGRDLAHSSGPDAPEGP